MLEGKGDGRMDFGERLTRIWGARVFLRLSMDYKAYKFSFLFLNLYFFVNLACMCSVSL